MCREARKASEKATAMLESFQTTTRSSALRLKIFQSQSTVLEQRLKGLEGKTLSPEDARNLQKMHVLKDGLNMAAGLMGAFRTSIDTGVQRLILSKR